MKYLVAAAAQANEVIQIIQFVPSVIVSPMMGTQVVLGVAQLASVVCAFLHRLRNPLPVIGLQVCVVFLTHWFVLFLLESRGWLGRKAPLPPRGKT